MKSWWQVLNVSPNATEDEVKAAYRKLAKKYHPDLCTSEQDRKLVNEKMSEVNFAYEEYKKYKAQSPNVSNNNVNYNDSDDFDWDDFISQNRKSSQDNYRRYYDSDSYNNKSKDESSHTDAFKEFIFLSIFECCSLALIIGSVCNM